MSALTGSRVYLDTIAWNNLLDRSSGRSLKRLQGPEYLFSSCNLDEFVLAAPGRTQQLTDIAWKLTNRKKLHDHLELMAHEVRAYQLREDAPLYEDDPGFQLAWETLRRGASPKEVTESARRAIRDAKLVFRDGLRLERDAFKRFFRIGRELGISYGWETFLREMEDEGKISLLIQDGIMKSGISEIVPRPEEITKVHYRSLAATAAGIQYYLALYYVVAHETGTTAKPDTGDQVDLRHAYYAGVSDLFVTDDKRMRQILSGFVQTRRARIVGSSEFFEIIGFA